ncbi:MAG: ABC transporter substrate-binding protein [Solirubrobacteraceae bacterium]
MSDGRYAGRRRGSSLAGLATLVVAAIALSACGSSTSAGNQGVTKTTILFGQTAPKSGPAALYGQSTAGVNAYFAMINAQGGVAGHKLQLTSVDDQYQPPVAVQQTRKLVDETKVFAEVAVNGSATTKADLTVLQPANVPLVGPQSGADYLQSTRKDVFNVWPSYRVEGKLLGTFASQKLHLGKVGVLYQNDDFGQSLFAGVKDSGLKPALAISYDPTQVDFGPQAQQFKSAGVDGVIILAIPQPTISFLNALAAINFKPVRIMSQVSAIPQSFSAAPREFPSSYIGAFIPPLDSASDPQVAQFRAAMAKYEAGAPASIFAAWGWMEAQVAVAGLKAIQGPITRDSYEKGLESLTNLTTLGGTIHYGPQSHLGVTKMSIVQARGSTLVAVPG